MTTYTSIKAGPDTWRENTGPGLADVRPQIDALMSFTFPASRSGQYVPEELRDLCNPLQVAMEFPGQLLADLEEDDTPVPQPVPPVGDEELRALAIKGVAEALWAGDVNIEQLTWVFSRPIDVRRLVLARLDVCLASISFKSPSNLKPSIGKTALKIFVKSRMAVRRFGQAILRPAPALLTATLFVGIAGGSVEYYRDQAQENEEKFRGAQAELVALHQARPVIPTPEEQFRLGFEDALRYRLRTYPDLASHRGRIDIELSPQAQPPYIMAVHVRRGENLPLERIYDVNFQPMEPPIRLDFSTQLPVAGEKQVTVTLVFYLPQDAIERLGGDITYIERHVPLTLTPEGVRVGISDPTGHVVAAIEAPGNDVQVDDRFMTKFTLQANQTATPEMSGRMMHLLIRPVDGPKNVRREYFVAPFRQRVDELTRQELPFSMFVSLRPILHKAAENASDSNELPRQFDVMLVELPFELLGWTVDRNVLDLEELPFSGLIRASCRVTLKPQSLEDIIAAVSR